MPAPSAIIKTDVIGVIGDSITAGFGLSAGWTFNFMRAVKARYAQPDVAARPSGLGPASVRPAPTVSTISVRQVAGPQAQASPSFVMYGVPGMKAGAFIGVMASVLPQFFAARTTVYVVELGTNDCGVTPAATFIPQITAIRDAIVAAPDFRMLVWVGPWSNGGENWPDGVNIVDTVLDGISDKDAQLSDLMASTPGGYYISWRQLRLNTINATTNPAHLTQGIYTLDGTHPTSAPTETTAVSGGDLLAQYTASLLTFQ